MKTIDIYIVKEWAAWFIASFGFLLSVLCLFSLADDVTNVFPRGFDSVTSDFVSWSWPFLPWLLPICALLSCLFLTGFLKKRGEWEAIQTVGISTIWCFRSVFLMGMIVSYSCWLISSKTLINDYNSRESIHHLKPLSIKSGTERMWYFSSFDDKTMTGFNVQLFQYDQSGENVFRIRADKANWDSANGWTFFEGKFLGFLSKKGVPVPNNEGHGLHWEFPEDYIQGTAFNSSPSPLISKHFDRLGGLELRDEPSLHLLLGVKPKELSFEQLNRLLKRWPNQDDLSVYPYLLRRAQLIWSGPGCMIALFAGLVLGTSKLSSSSGKLGGLSIIAALFYYTIRTISDSLVETGIIEPSLGASLPYLSSFLAIIFLTKIR